MIIVVPISPIPIPIVSYNYSEYLKAEKCAYSVMHSKQKLPSWQVTPEAL